MMEMEYILPDAVIGCSSDHTNLFSQYKRLQLTQIKTHERHLQPPPQRNNGENKFGPAPHNHLEKDHLVFEYEMVLKVEEQQISNDQNTYTVNVEGHSNDDALMNNYSLLKFRTNEILGLTEGSLSVVQETMVSGQVDINLQSPELTSRDLNDPECDFIKIKADRMNNTVTFEYDFKGAFKDYLIKFKVLMKDQFDMSMCDTRNYQFNQSSHQFHSNGYRIGFPTIVDHLDKGFSRTGSIEHYHYNAVDESEDINDEIPSHIEDSSGNVQAPSDDGPVLSSMNMGPPRGRRPAGRMAPIRRPSAAYPNRPKAAYPSGRLNQHRAQSNVDIERNEPVQESSGLLNMFGYLGYRRARKGTESPNTDKMKKLRISGEERDNGEKFLIRVEYTDHPSFLIRIDKTKRVLQLKEMMEKCLELYNFNIVRTNEMGLLFKTERLEDDTKLMAIPGINIDGCNIFALVTTRPGFPRAFEDRALREDLNVNQQRAKNVMNSCRILLRNFQACVSNASHELSPGDRVRFNVPPTKTQENVISNDLGIFVTEVSEVVREFAVELSKLSNHMVQDRALDRDSPQYINYKKSIQNLMDAARYASPMFLNLAKFTIPLNRTSPRLISVIPHP